MLEINNYDIIADLYDTYVPVDFDLEFFLNETKKTSGEVLELMSGTGRVSIPLLEAGVILTCVDISPKSNAILVEKLKQMGYQADVIRMDAAELDLPKKFAMVIIPFSSFAHIVSLVDQRKTLERIYQHLLPGGTFICTLGNPLVRRSTVDGQLRLAYSYSLPDKRGKLLLWILEEFDPQDDHIVDAHEFFEEYDADGVMTSKRLMDLRFRLSTKDEFEAQLKATGFSIKALFGDYAYNEFNPESSSTMVWLLEKLGA